MHFGKLATSNKTLNHLDTKWRPLHDLVHFLDLDLTVCSTACCATISFIVICKVNLKEVTGYLVLNFLPICSDIPHKTGTVLMKQSNKH